MPRTQSDPESWKRMVLQSQAPPAWLAQDAPQSDVALSSRARFMRNLACHKFAHAASPDELAAILHQVLEAVSATGLDLEVLRTMTNAERDYLVSCRLISPDFPWREIARAVLLDDERSLSVMVNEEDHLRLQALTAGWSIDTADALARGCLDALEDRIQFAWSPDFGYLSASPYNAGEGRRLSSMLHLIGLAQARRLPQVLRALSVKGLTARGLFGESSRAVGAFMQVSVLSGARSEFVGACEYLIREERAARQTMPRETLERRARQAMEFAITSRTISLADALRVLAWLRWASTDGLEGFRYPHRRIDAFLTTLEVGDEHRANAPQHRAEALRAFAEELGS